MDPKNKKNHDVLTALDKMERESARLEEEKRILKKRTKKPVIIPEINRQEIINQQNAEDNKKNFESVKNNGLLIAFVIVTTIMLTYSLTKEARTTLIENFIMLFCFCGIILTAFLKR
ncbi:MAG: hypothetical protein H0V66_03635 [Bdellovibrionales bacterium]|nr:hypothetical protein [Bdellovibrionales bacterium]